MELLSLPPEILSLICQYAILTDLQPRRLHPCTNSRYLRKASRRRELSCPPLLLCCRDLLQTSSQVFYQNVTVVIGLDYHSQPYYFRCYPTPDKDKDTLSVLTGRTSVLPYIKNLELMISRTISYDPRTCHSGQDLFFRSNREDPTLAVSTVRSKLPNLKTLRWTVGIGAVVNESLAIWPHIATTEHLNALVDDERTFHYRGAWRVPFSHYHTLSAVLKYPPRGLEAASFRLWLTRSHLYRLTELADRQGPMDASKDSNHLLKSLVPRLRAHPILKSIALLPNLHRLDVFMPQDPTPYSHHESAHGPLPIDDANIEKLKMALEVVFEHVKEVRFWRALSENVTSGEYEAF